jgi:hypothetical protein
MGPLLRTYDHLRGNGLIGLVLVRHLNETETPGLARELILDVLQVETSPKTAKASLICLAQIARQRAYFILEKIFQLLAFLNV